MKDPKISNLRQLASLTRYTLTEGRGKGLDVIDCDNGKIRFMLCVSRALDIMQLWHEGQNVSFISKNGFVSENVPFLNRFEGGMLYTCGLDSVGGRDGFELHGTHHITAADLTRIECTDEGITVEATISVTSLFGKNLMFKRRIFTAISSESVSINDTLINNGYVPDEYCLLYHINVGYPMLDADATVEGDITAVSPRNVYAGEHIEKSLKTEEAIYPEETCYYLDTKEGMISLKNEKLAKRFSVKYSKDTLPEFLLWKSMVAGDYALGLEPTTTKLDDLFAYRKIAAGEKINFSVELSVCKI